MPATFNPGQQKVYDQLKHFVDGDTEHDTYILKGYAGTGKTFLIQQFAYYLRKQKIKFSMLATTGRAAAVLRGKTDLETRTVHSALYSFTGVEGDNDNIPIEASVDEYGQMRLLFTPNDRLEEECVYIVDEASMLANETPEQSSFAVFGSGQLLSDLFNAIGKNKIIFVGDDAQLPPIFQEFSPALDQEYLKRLNRNTLVGSLTRIMRTKEDNDILKVATAVREKIGSSSTTKWIKLPARNRNNCTILPDRNSLYLEFYATFLQYGPKKCIAIAHSNKACRHLNHHIRKRLFPESSNLIEEGEVLMVTQNNYIVPLTNGDFVKVLKLGEVSHRMGMKFRNLTVKHLETDKEYEIITALQPFANYEPNFTNDQQRLLMIDFSRRMKSMNIKPNSLQYKNEMRNDPYLNSLKVTYGYVVTCHKSQGGEWDYVYLFLDAGMYGYMSHIYMRRWWYTAITRTMKQLYLHNEWWLSE